MAQWPVKGGFPIYPLKMGHLPPKSWRVHGTCQSKIDDLEIPSGKHTKSN